MTVNAILDATAHILIRQGYAKLTTNAVAELAGVSIGSLYQYFPNKKALLVALYQRHCKKMKVLLSQEMKKPLDIFDRHSIGALIQSVIKAHLIETQLHQRFESLQDEINLTDGLQEQGFDALAEQLTYLISKHQKTLRVQNVHTTVWLLMNTVHTLVHLVVKQNRAPAEMEMMTAEITRMIYGYIRMTDL